MMRIRIRWENALSEMRRKGGVGIRRNKLLQKEPTKNDEAELEAKINELQEKAFMEGYRYAIQILEESIRKSD